MKKYFTLVICLFLFQTFVKAQTQKGNQLLGGSILFGITNAKVDHIDFGNSFYNFSYKSKQTSFSAGPIYSYFIADKLDLGLSLGYGSDKTLYNYTVANTAYSILPYKSNSTVYYSGIYLRKYFLYNQKIGIRTGPFAEYENYKYSNEYLEPQLTNNNYSQRGSYINAGLILDVVYFPSKRIGLTSNIGNLGYINSNSNFNTLSSNEQDHVNSFGLRFISNLNLSMVYCFR